MIHWICKKVLWIQNNVIYRSILYGSVCDLIKFLFYSIVPSYHANGRIQILYESNIIINTNECGENKSTILRYQRQMTHEGFKIWSKKEKRYRKDVISDGRQIV